MAGSEQAEDIAACCVMAPKNPPYLRNLKRNVKLWKLQRVSFFLVFARRPWVKLLQIGLCLNGPFNI